MPGLNEELLNLHDREREARRVSETNRQLAEAERKRAADAEQARQEAREKNKAAGHFLDLTGVEAGPRLFDGRNGVPVTGKP